MAKKQRNSFIMYYDWLEVFDMFTEAQRGALITAIFRYMRYGIIDENMPSELKVAFRVIRLTLDRDTETYEDKCKVNSENGKKGGRPSSRRLSQNQTVTKKGYSDSDSDSDSEIDSDSDSYSGSGSEGWNPHIIPPYRFSSVCEESSADSVTSSSADSVTPRSAPKSEEKNIEEKAEQEGDDSLYALTDEERERLISKGVDEEYVDERRGRAEIYAKENGMTAYDVLMHWWAKDRVGRSVKKKGRAERDVSPPMNDKDRDMEEWFERRLSQSFG